MWQCAGSADGTTRRPCEGTWRFPLEYRFAVDKTTMRANSNLVDRCIECGGLPRPNVLMFHDKNWIANASEEVRIPWCDRGRKLNMEC